MSVDHDPNHVIRRLRYIGPGGSTSPGGSVTGCPVSVHVDLDGKTQAMERLRQHPFVEGVRAPEFERAQLWIERCGRDVALPLNFCGGLLIMRFYRSIACASEQTPAWMALVHEAAATYDFAFLALAHADDEADMTLVREGRPTRFVTHPDTRAVDGVNLLLTGISAMQDALDRWPCIVDGTEGVDRHPLATEVMSMLLRALREASFPILLDRSGLGHRMDYDPTASGLGPILVDGQSLERIEAFTRHRAHTYFMRAIDLATLLAGFSGIEPDLRAALDDLFGLLGLLGAAMDDLQDLVIDFAAGIHSACTVMAHLCVAEEPAVRPRFRRALPEALVADQRRRLADLFGATDAHLDRDALLNLLDEIALRRALTEHLEGRGTLFAVAIHHAVTKFGFSPALMTEIVAVVCGDPEFAVPQMYHVALATISDETILGVINVQVGKFITAYFIGRFWPAGAAPD